MFTGPAIRAFTTDLMDSLLLQAAVLISPKIPSRTLRDALQRRNFGLKGDLFIPHFWALFVHDGRGPFGPKSARFLVFFQDPNDDPRKPTPEREASARKLTRGEFDAGIAENRRLQALNPTGGPMQHMIVVRNRDGSPGRVGGVRGSFFFTVGAQQFERKVDKIVLERFDRFVKSHIINETVTARIRL